MALPITRFLVVFVALLAWALAASPRADAAVSASTIGAAMPGSVTVSNVTVTGTSGGATTATATMTAGSDPTQVSVSISYTDSEDWTVTMASNSAVSTYAPVSGIALDINDISGTFWEQDGVLSWALTGSVQVGNTSVPLAVTIDSSGFTGSASPGTVEVGGTEVTNASVSAASQDHTLQVAGDIVTEGGTFDASLSLAAADPVFCFWGSCTSLTGQPDLIQKIYTMPDYSPNGQAYTVTLSVSGADLAGSSASFGLTSFGFTTVVYAPNDGCMTIDVAPSGTLDIGGDNTLTLNSSTNLQITCNTLTAFDLSVTYAHTMPAVNLTKAVTLAIGWGDCSSPATTPCTYTLPTGAVVSYSNGYFGAADFTVTKDFSDAFGVTQEVFERTINFGVGLGVAVYTPYPSAPQTTAIAGGGAVWADRVGGSLACTLITSTSTDFSCTANFDVNPSWAGKYGRSWTGF